MRNRELRNPQVSAGRPGAPEGAPAVPRKPYSAPRLECHGRLVDLTRFGGSQTIDSGASSLGNLS